MLSDFSNTAIGNSKQSKQRKHLDDSLSSTPRELKADAVSCE